MDTFTHVNVYFNYGFFFKRVFISAGKNATVEIQL